MFYTYAHTRNDDGKIFYIGKGSNYRATAKNRNKHWQSIVNKFGYKVEILAYWDCEKDALDHESLLISCFKDMKYELANKASGGDANSGWNHSEECKKRMSELRKKLSDDIRIKLSEAAKGEKNSFFGKKHSEETKKKMSIAAKNRKPNWINKTHTEETKNKMSESQKARWSKFR